MGAPFRSGADLGVFDWPRWEDLKFPAQGIDPVGLTAPPSRDASSGLLVFSGSQNNAIAGVAQMPHGWKPGSSIYPHIHIRFGDATPEADSDWEFGYDIANVGSDFSNAVGTYTTLSTPAFVSNGSTVRHAIGSFGALSMSGYRESAVILWTVIRYGLTDAYGAGIYLLEFDIHYQIEKSGTVVDFPS